MQHQIKIDDIWTDINESELVDGQPCRILYPAGDSVELEYKKPDEPLPVHTLKPVIEGADLVGNIYHVNGKEDIVTISGDTTMPDSNYVIMLQVLKDGKTPVSDYGRFPAAVVNGKFSCRISLPSGDNYLLSKDRLNTALENLGAKFRVKFDPIEFNSLTVV